MTDADPSLERTFKGHRGAVSAVAFTPSLRSLASGGADGDVIVWHFRLTLKAWRFQGHTAAVNDVAVSADGLIASAGQDQTVRLWAYSSSGKSTVVKTTHPVRAVHFSPDGRLLASAADCKTIKLWAVHYRPSSTSVLRSLGALGSHSNWVRCTRFSPDGRLVASASDDRTLRVWDVETRQETHSFEHVGVVHSLAWFQQQPDCGGQIVATGGSDGFTRLWDLRSGALWQSLVPGTSTAAAVRSLSFHPLGNCLSSGSADGALRLWDVRRASLGYTMLGHALPPPAADRPATPRRQQGGVLGCAFSPRGDFLASSGADGQILVWRTNAQSVVGDASEPPPPLPEARPPPMRHPPAASMHSRGWSPSPIPVALLARPHAPEPPEQTPEPEGCGPEDEQEPIDYLLHREGRLAEEATLEGVLAQLELMNRRLERLEDCIARQEAQLARVSVA